VGFLFPQRLATLPEYLERRFLPGSRTMLAVMGVVGALFIHIGVSLYAGAAIIERFFGLDAWGSILIISVATAIYTVVGGLMAVVVTEAVQTVLLLAGAAIVTVLGVMALGEQGIDSLAALKAEARPNQLSMIRHEGDDPWYAMLLGYPVLGVWYWRADQTIVQRVLGAADERDARIGPIFAGFIKVLPVFLMVLPGVMAYVLFADVIGDDADQTLPVMIEKLVPTGLKGLLAALMSTVAGALNSASTLVSIDIVKRLRPQTSEARLVGIGRVTAVVFVLDFPAFGFGWITGSLGIPFMLQAWWLFVICCVIFVGVSMLTPAPPRRMAAKQSTHASPTRNTAPTPAPSWRRTTTSSAPNRCTPNFRQIALNSPIDVTLYNIPMFASPIDVPTVRRLAELDRITGIKDSSGDIAQMMRMITAVRPLREDFTFLCGWDAALVPMLMMGCDGGTNSMAGVLDQLKQRGVL